MIAVKGGAAALLFLLALSCTTARAEEDDSSANHALPGCRDVLANRSTMIGGMCLGMVRGIAVMAASTRSILAVAPTSGAAGLCVKVPSEATGGQMVKIVVDYIDRQAQRWHEDFMALALEALQAA